MSTRDYTDSESDGDIDTPSRPIGDGDISAASTPRDMSPTNSSPTKPGPSDHPMRITLRPGLAHLADAASTSSTPERSASPPRFKIKLGMKHSLSASAIYSSSEDESDAPKGKDKEKDKDRSPPAKKQRTKKGSKAASSTAAAPESSPAPSGSGPKPVHRKTYNWLQPSAAGASHHGPEGRERQASAVSHSSVLDSDSKRGTSEEASARGSAPPEPKPKKSRRKPEGSGLGKNWRKGIRKGDPMPWKDGPKSSPLATPQRASVSREVSPDLDAMLLATVTREREREPSPPFVLADAAKLGIPVFPNPIVSPKISLGPFPKVTQFFAPFDQKPFRKEKVRDWTYGEKTIQSVGGGTLKFKTWSRGPQSELGVVLQAQREADAAAKAAKRESKMNKDSEPPPERPTFAHSLSNDSVPRAASVDGDNESEAGDGDESAIMSARESPAPSPAASRRRKAPAKPRKSKLAQEIKPETDADEATPTPKVEDAE